ncbi:MAG: hypothetical protein FWE13_05255 [Firmicutes bacterium]|nr:hypothetical protein [Bacillota bacterium]
MKKKLKKFLGLGMAFLMPFAVVGLASCISGCDVYVDESHYQLQRQIELLQQQIADLQEQLNAWDR